MVVVVEVEGDIVTGTEEEIDLEASAAAVALAEVAVCFSSCRKAQLFLLYALNQLLSVWHNVVLNMAMTWRLMFTVVSVEPCV